MNQKPQKYFTHTSRWPLELPLLNFEGVNWTLRDACNGTLVLGGIGGGKSSSSVMAWDYALIEAGAGGLVLVVKAGEADLIRKRAADCGRLNDLIIFSPNENHCFNPFDWMLRRKMSVSTLSYFCETVMEVVNGPLKEADAFFKPQERGLLESALTVVGQSGHTVTPALLGSFIAALPKTPEEADAGHYENTLVGDCIRKARQNVKQSGDEDAVEVVEAAIDYFLREYPSQPDKTRACVEMSLAGLLRPFSLSPLLRKLFCGETNIDPNALIEEGKILVCDLPINRDRQVGRLANALWKTAFQMAVEQREDTLGDAMRPVFLRLEEGQELFTVQDCAFQAKCRSSRCATCFITQNLPGMYARTNGDKYAVDSFFGNLSTHIYHSNSDVDTCEYMSRQLGKSRRLRVAGSTGEKSWADKWLGGGGGGGKGNDLSVSSDLSPNVFTDEFRRLKRGGPPDYESTAYVLLMGKAFSTGRHYALVSFSQRPPSESNDVQDSPLPLRPSISRSLTVGLSKVCKSVLSLGSWMGFGPNAKR